MRFSVKLGCVLPVSLGNSIADGRCEESVRYSVELLILP